MILRGGKQIEEPKRVSNDKLLHHENVKIIENEVSTSSKDVNDDDDVSNSIEFPKDPKFTSPKTLHFAFTIRSKNG